jgi:hypothetical protein
LEFTDSAKTLLIFETENAGWWGACFLLQAEVAIKIGKLEL